MKNTSLFILIGIFTVFNIGLIYLNAQKQDKINNLERKSRENIDHIVDSNLVMSTSLRKHFETTLSLVVIFTNQGCEACATNEIRDISKLNKKYFRYIHVYIIGRDKPYLKRRGASFPIHSVTSAKSLFDSSFTFTNPVAILVDANGMIQQIHRAKVGEPSNSKRFYNRTASLFASIQ